MAVVFAVTEPVAPAAQSPLAVPWLRQLPERTPINCKVKPVPLGGAT
jgi:hypothetical protein